MSQLPIRRDQCDLIGCICRHGDEHVIAASGSMQDRDAIGDVAGRDATAGLAFEDDHHRYREVA